MHGPVRVPRAVGAGIARATIAFESWKEGSVAPTQHAIPLLASRTADFKLEAVSSRLKGELIHPIKSGSITNIQFSPDGKRIVAGDYPGGTVVVWDLASGKQLSTMEAGYGLRATMNYFAISPDWRTVFSWNQKRQVEQVEQNGKRMFRWTCDSGVRAWDLESGKLRRVYKHQPPHYIRIMKLASDGKTIFTFDELPGTFEGRGKNAISLWDVSSGKSIVLDKLNSSEFTNVFSQDGKVLAVTSHAEKYNAQALKLIDATSGQEKWSLPIRQKNASVYPQLFSRDGRLLFGIIQAQVQPGKSDQLHRWIKWWDAADGHEVASFACDPDDKFNFFTNTFILTPDGRKLVVLCQGARKSKLLCYSIAEKRLVQTNSVGEASEGYLCMGSGLAFSPDGKWLAVVTRLYPEKATPRDVDAQDLPQPRIHLIETATGTIRETLIAPQSFSSRVCFSPDGRTLATDGPGRVLLWDLSKPPGEK